MSKIICDVCGTSYPETVSQCPICGCVRSVDSRVMPSNEENAQQASAGSYTFVKGGRFSKSNVRKRQKTRGQEMSDPDEDQHENENKKADKGLLIAFIVLLLSVAAVVCYIIVKFTSPDSLNPNAGKKPVIEGNNDPVISTEQETVDLSCQGITFAQDSTTLTQAGQTYQISVTLTPEDTTDVPVFASSDESVVTVTNEGLVTAVGAGEASVTVTCGDVQKVFSVVCNIQTVDPTLPSVPDVDLPVVPAGFALKKEDITFAKKGQSFNLYDGNPDIKDEITWTSSDPKVATVTNGKVVAVSKGRVTITAEYKGTKLTCIVRCKDAVGEYVDPETQDPATATYKLSSTDVSINIGESFTLKLLDGNNQNVDVTFTNSNADVCTLSGNKITGASAGKADISVTYEGVTYTCIVRVRGE